MANKIQISRALGGITGAIKKGRWTDLNMVDSASHRYTKVSRGRRHIRRVAKAGVVEFNRGL